MVLSRKIEGRGQNLDKEEQGQPLLKGKIQSKTANSISISK